MKQDRNFRNKPMTYSPWTYNQSMTKEARICNGEKIVCIKWCWENKTAICKRMQLENSLT